MGEKWKLLSHVQLLGLYEIHGILQARILELVAVPFSSRSSQPRDQTQVSRIAGRFFTSWATREAQMGNYYFYFLSQQYADSGDREDLEKGKATHFSILA